MAGCSASVIQFPTTALWPSCNDGSIAEQSQLCCLNKDVAVLLSVSRRCITALLSPPLAIAKAAYCVWAVGRFGRLLPNNAYIKKQKKQQSNLELWSLLTTYRKSYMGFSKNQLLDP